jgi:transglutaminase-like putative cysteine protease
LLPHLWRAPLWLATVALALLVVRGVISRRGWHLPPKLLTLAGAGLSAVAVTAKFGTIFGRDAGVALLVLMSCLKLLETRSRRDTMIAVFLAYFLMLTHFLFDQSLLTAGYMLATGWATTTVLIAISHRRHARLGLVEGRLAAVLLVQGLPIMALLFVLFPRLPGPLWGLPDDAHAGVTGLSDTMSPGSLSQLSQSDAVAFRVRFDGDPPPPQQRYWRGLVLADYNGEDWTRADVSAPPRRVTDQASPIDYTVTVEPHNERWLFALDLPANNPASGSLTFFHERRNSEPVRETMRYQGRSYTEYRLQPDLGKRSAAIYTELPAGRHERARALARSWAAEAGTDRAVVDRALAYIRNQPFEYTLTPEPLPDDHVDGFLFETRSGFCEHYAGAFAVLMRAAGIPARVVTGYQGASRSATGDYWTVRQSDAHAWTEVWLPEAGWQRIDPTGAVSPERVEYGLGAAVSANEPVPTMARGGETSWLRTLGRSWDVIDATWTDWVISYGPDRQQSFLSSIGLDDTLRLVGALAGGVVGFMAILGVGLLRQQMAARDPDQASRLWRRAQRQLRRRGIHPRAGEGPRDYADRAKAAAPELAATLREIERTYLRLRYYPQPSHQDLARLRAAVRRLARERRRIQPS